MKKHSLFIMALIVLVLSACGSPETTEGGATVQEIPVTVEVTRIVEVAVETEVEVEVTRLVEVEVTREVEVAAAPTATAEPEPTSTEPPEESIVISGSGNDLIDIEKWDGPAALHATAVGEGEDFTVERFDVDGDSRRPIWDEAPYDGVVSLDFGSATTTTRFSVEAPGDWTLEVLPMSQLPVLEVPGLYEGSGNAIIGLTGETPDLATVTGDDAGRYFSIEAYGYGTDNSLYYADNSFVVSTDELPYEGPAVISADTAFLVIAHDGNWTIEVTGK